MPSEIEGRRRLGGSYVRSGRDSSSDQKVGPCLKIGARFVRLFHNL